MTAKEFSVSKFIEQYIVECEAFEGYVVSTYDCKAIATDGKTYTFQKIVRLSGLGIVQKVTYSNIQESE